MKEYEEWLRRAKDDLALAQIARQNQFHAHACFLCQQTAEKSFKSYLLWKQNSYPRMHGLVDLLNLCARHEPNLQSLLTVCQILDQYYTQQDIRVAAHLIPAIPMRRMRLTVLQTSCNAL